ncbi:MAG TPA: hypothetical protein VEF89_33240 [Solirubrobacteraceae bacterium]|nr:hypothetical protein [Solirubrobacteraceae bacterium]
MNSNPAALIACESVLDPILEQLTAVLDEHSANFAGPVAEALERLRSTAADTSLTISAATSRRSGQYHPSTAGLSSYIAVTVTPTDVSPCETRARCAVNDSLPPKCR